MVLAKDAIYHICRNLFQWYLCQIPNSRDLHIFYPYRL